MSPIGKREKAGRLVCAGPRLLPEEPACRPLQLGVPLLAAGSGASRVNLRLHTDGNVRQEFVCLCV